MKKHVKAAVLSAAGLLFAGSAVRAALYRPKKENVPEMPEEKVDLERYIDALCRAIRCRTVSNNDPSLVDWEEFRKLREVFESCYPLIHEKLSIRKIGKAGIIYTWEGSDPSLRPIALLGHQDVVPVPKDKLADWTHPSRRCWRRVSSPAGQCSSASVTTRKWSTPTPRCSPPRLKRRESCSRACSTRAARYSI